MGGLFCFVLDRLNLVRNGGSAPLIHYEGWRKSEFLTSKDQNEKED